MDMKKSSSPLELDDIKGARDTLRISQDEMARRLGVSQPTILRWERHGLPEGWQFGAVRERVADFIRKVNRDEAAKAKKKARANELAL